MSEDLSVMRPMLLPGLLDAARYNAARGRAHVSRFDAASWHATPITLTTPISASVSTSDTDLPRIRFVMDPEAPVVRGTRKVR